MSFVQRYQQHIAVINASRAYLWAQLATMLVYVLYFTAYTLPLINISQPFILLAFTLKYSIEAACFVSLSHLALRPWLKLMQHSGASIKRLLGFSSIVLLASLLQSGLSYFLVKLNFLKSTDMSLITINDPSQASTLQMNFSAAFVLITYTVMFAVMYLVWTFAYVLWHNWQARKLLQKQMQQAQLQQLTNQLNPHFLFNALNSIRALIFEDQHKAADTVTRLSELFRFHLQAHLQPESTLEQEWQLTEQYLAIEQVRLEQRLQFRCQIDAALLQHKLPTLSLLTLTENAIKHGIAPTASTGELTITAKIAAQTITKSSHTGWQLIVSNSVQSATQQPSTGTGLANLRQRLQLMYGQNARLQHSRDGNVFCVQLELTDEV
ncbi:sensor histidine kinase [Rheinheimera salexigens]|uniref:Signal transduction histidine kinase internal region domain-containing protein n=1 Tax=Rheinheimera salexigens TaxID=1628148 RepID=A0A1E7Q5Y5_9GAMM|nr:histidine kinase [Rheinheimera salexigens]OEY69592.1 hypothetical protein BI198_08485 [Rheinheimera salexigens]